MTSREPSPATTTPDEEPGRNAAAERAEARRQRSRRDSTPRRPAGHRPRVRSWWRSQRGVARRAPPHGLDERRRRALAVDALPVSARGHAPVPGTWPCPGGPSAGRGGGTDGRRAPRSGARKYGTVPSASAQTRTRSASHQRATSRQPGTFSTFLTSNGEPGTPANGSRRWGTPSRSASAAQSRGWRSTSWRTPAGSPRPRTRSSTPGPSTGSTSQTLPSARSACEARCRSGGSAAIQPKPKSVSSQKVIVASVIAVVGCPSCAQRGETALAGALVSKL